MHELLIAPFVDFAFMRRALMGCFALSLSAPPLGVFLILRRMSLIGDAMSHAILPGVALGYLIAGFSLAAMSLGGFIAGLGVALVAGVVSRSTRLKEDSSLAAFYLISLALGVLLISARGAAIDLMQVLFGTVLSLNDASLMLIAGVAVVTVIGLVLIRRPLLLECVDPVFLRSVSRSGPAVHLVFLGLVVLNLVGGFSALGTLLAVGIMLLPAAAARLWASGLWGLIALSVLIAIASCMAGLLVSYHFDVPSGPAIILAAGMVYVASLAVAPHGAWMQRHR